MKLFYTKNPEVFTQRGFFHQLTTQTNYFLPPFLPLAASSSSTFLRESAFATYATESAFAASAAFIASSAFAIESAFATCAIESAFAFSFASISALLGPQATNIDVANAATAKIEIDFFMFCVFIGFLFVF